MSQMASLVAYRHYLLLYVCWIICWKVKKYDDIRQIIQFKIFRIVTTNNNDRLTAFDPGQPG